MKLFTHNFLVSIEDVKNNYPLDIEATEVKPVDFEDKKEFVIKMLPRLNYGTLIKAIRQIPLEIDLPDILPDDATNNETFLNLINQALFGFEIMEGYLICPESKHKYKITRGIPKMMLDTI